MEAEAWSSDTVTEGRGEGGGDNGYAKGQCTWWARLMRPDIPLFPGPSGDAKNWATSARQAEPELQVGETAKPGAVVVFKPGQAGAGEYGHVAYVEAVNRSKIRISEANFLDTKPGHERTLRWRGRGFRFIYEREQAHRSDPRPVAGVFRFAVYRTCMNGSCGLKRRQGPGLSFPLVSPSLQDGAPADITCQVGGDRVVGFDATSTNVWDRVADGSYVSDYYVDTPGKNDQFTIPIPRCGLIAMPTELTRAPPPTVTLLAPAPQAILAGTARVAAASNAPAVRFEALYADDPGVPNSATWHLLGTDSSPGDGFATEWGTTAVPNQGSAHQGTIKLRATALDAVGGLTSAADERRVFTANPGLNGAFAYHVIGSCIVPVCKLNRRSGPGFSGFPSVGMTAEGGKVEIVCQAQGEVVDVGGGPTDVWNEFVDGTWGSDQYLDTPVRGAFSPPIPRCESVPEPPVFNVQLTSPEAGKTLTGTAQVSATSNAPAVRFEAFYADDPGVPESAGWHLLGTDSSPGNGLAIQWDTTEVANQGLASQNTIRVRATALDYREGPAAVSAIRRVTVANPSEDGTFAFHVYGTCLNQGECIVNIRSGPGQSSYSIVGSLPEGARVDIVCQTHGEMVNGGSATDVWNKVGEDTWVTDYYIDTPVGGAFSPPMPVC